MPKEYVGNFVTDVKLYLDKSLKEESIPVK